ncbi:MAG: NYN domain-containing protein [Gemmatimonadetes bacterium]|nr:NYN domain-containing protein [Gemmatimonadota bacterium]
MPHPASAQAGGVESSTNVKEHTRLRGGTGLEPPPYAPYAAMMIDFDNVTLGIRSDLQTQLKRLLASEVFKGKISVQRAYADWRRYPQYIVPLSEASIDLIFAPAFGSNKKNATDIRLAIDALELVFTRPEIGTFILLSGDSDFSSLVLKLKEYGKFVIGVGIRESSSDLLIQNCDEYYSYNELTGLAKESDIEHPRHDPWELVVEAVTRMKQNRDVMRSDRLKQVMQEIDPNFDEGEVGFSRFSKFVLEASSRGLIRLTKLDNGQYEIDLGTNANISADVESALAVVAATPAPPGGSRGRGRRGGGGRDRVERAAPTRGVTLAQAFDALRDILIDLSTVGGEATDAEQVRERMVTRFGADDPIVEETRYRRLLKQAHDATVIELVKTEGDDDAFLIRLGARGAATDAVPDVAAPSAPEGGEPGAPADSTERPRERHRGGRGRGRGRGRAGERGAEREEQPRSSPAPSASPVEREPAHDSAPPPPPPPRPAPPAVPAAPGQADVRRSVRFRSGSKRAVPPATPAVAPAVSERPAAAPTPAPPAPPRAQRPPAPPAPSVAPSAPRVAGSSPPEEPKSLFKRMSAALQKALGTEDNKE